MFIHIYAAAAVCDVEYVDCVLHGYSPESFFFFFFIIVIPNKKTSMRICMQSVQMEFEEGSAYVRLYIYIYTVRRSSEVHCIYIKASSYIAYNSGVIRLWRVYDNRLMTHSHPI